MTMMMMMMILLVTYSSAQYTETDNLIDELPVEKRRLSKLIIICRI